jgi:ABC-type glycerol-3-phosphate transport system substrate-binding protein
MMKNLKITSFILAMLMILMAFSACGGGTAPAAPAADPADAAPVAPPPPPEAPAAPAPAEDAPAEKIQLTLGLYPADTNDAEIAAYEQFIANYNTMRPDVEVIPAHYFYALDTIVPTAESGNLPVIFDPWFTEPQKLIKAGYVRPVTALLAKRGWDNMMNASIRQLLTANNELYGIPRDGYALGLQLNMDLFAQAGLVTDGVPTYPKTWEELATMGKQIKDATGMPALCLLAQDNAGGWHWSNIAWAFGATLSKDNGDGSFTAQLNTPEAIAAMEYTKSLKWEYDILTADPLSENWGTGWQQLASGAAAMYIGANDGVNQPTAVNGLPVDKLALVPLPAGPGGQYSLSGGTTYMFAANASDAQVDAALDFVIANGRAPEVTPELKKAMETDAAARKETGTPVIKRFPVWSGTDYADAEAEAIAPYVNIDMRLYNDYFAAVSAPGNLRLEEQGMTQEMYAELTSVLQAVLTDVNADVTALMNTANSNYQTILDNAGY